MSESEQQQQEDMLDPIVLPGNTLRAARQAKNLQIRDIAARLNLADDVVEALELDDYDSLPEPTYIRGYLLAYVRLMELPESTLESFDEQNDLNTPLLSTNTAEGNVCSQDGWVKCISGGLIVLLVIVIGLWLLEQSFNIIDSVTEEQVATQTEPAHAESEDASALTEQPVTDETEPMANITLEAPAADSIASTEEPKVDESISANVDEPAASEATATSPESSSETTGVQNEALAHDLVLSFSDSSWIKITDANGNTLRSGTFSNGDRIELTGEAPFALTLGKAKHVELSYLGEPVDLSDYYNRVARLVVGEVAD